MADYYQYYVEGLEKKKNAQPFFRTLFAYSDAFSLIYFKYHESEKVRPGTAKIEQGLSPFLIHSQEVTRWPGTEVLNEFGRIYRMDTYRLGFDVIFDILPTFEKVKTLWDWDYPKYPMDPCFYKDGFAWFSSCTHERINTLYLKDDENFPFASDLESLGVTLIPDGKVNESALFYHKY